MKAFFLVAGEGTRLRPLTNFVPKCLAPIRGVPLLGIWFKLFKLYGVRDLLINLHHLPHRVGEYIKTHGSGLNVTAFYEKQLLGSAGTVLSNMDFVKDEELFFIVYGDNLTNINLRKMAD